MGLVDNRYVVQYYNKHGIKQCSNKELKKLSISVLKHQLEAFQSILKNTSNRRYDLNFWLRKEFKVKGYCQFFKRIICIFSCFIFSPVKKAKKELKQLKRNKTIIMANISTLRNEIDTKQRSEIDLWWQANYNLTKKCFLDSSINRFKTIVFVNLNRCYNIKDSAFLKCKQILKNNLKQISIFLDNTKIELGQNPSTDKKFIKALVGIHPKFLKNDCILDIVSSFLTTKSEKVFVVASTQNST